MTLDDAGTLNAGVMTGQVRTEGANAMLTKGTKTVEVSDMMVSVNGGNLDVN